MNFCMKLFSYCTYYNFFFFSDPPNGEEWQALDDGLAYGTDMVRHIRQEFGDCFTVCVAGEEKMRLFFINYATCSCSWTTRHWKFPKMQTGILV